MNKVLNKSCNELYDFVENQYFQSGDFNGLPLFRLTDKFDVESDMFMEVLRYSIENEILTARFYGNTHIRAFSKDSKKNILEFLSSDDFPSQICLYPHKNILINSSRLIDYANSPYDLEIAKGAGQLDFRVFDLSVLEYYRKDPRYSYNTDSIHGSICISDEFFESTSVLEHDKILLETFGFAYDDNFNRYVAVFIRYLSNLSPEHQNIWKVKEMKGDFKMHQDYHDANILGSWDTKMSIFEAFIQELEIINQMSFLIGKPKLFLKSFRIDTPKEFGFLLRPTESEFNDFMLLLDKMMSDNLNKKFFKGDIALEIDEERNDGKVIVRQKGTIQLLNSWISKYFRPKDNEPIIKMIATFRLVRKLRQKPAHKVNKDKFDQNIFLKQRKIVIDSYTSIRTLRLILANHPYVKNNPPTIHEQLLKGEISDF